MREAKMNGDRIERYGLAVIHSHAVVLNEVCLIVAGITPSSLSRFFPLSPLGDDKIGGIKRQLVEMAIADKTMS